MVKSVGKIGIAVMISRVFGLIRDQVFASCFGVGLINDAYFMAFRIPNLLRDLFAEGALSSAFVTVFARKKTEEGDEGAWKLARIVMTFQTFTLGIIVILGIVFAPQIVHLMAPKFETEPGKTELTILLVRILFPFILFVAMAALSMGLLNTYGRFGLPASASSFFNLGSIVIGVGLAWIFDPQFGKTGIICMAIGTIAGGMLQWLIQVPAMKKLGYRFYPNFNFRDQGLREILKLIGPAVIGVSAVQINVLINSQFASAFSGGVTMLAFAFRLIQLPIGLFGVSISTANLPSFSVDATHVNKEAFRKRVEDALRLNAVLCIPAACGLAVLAEPIIGLLFQRGKFDERGTIETSRILGAYCIGLVGYSSIKIIGPAFYALNRVAAPMFVSLGSIVATYLLNWFFVNQTTLGPAGLALTTSITALFGAALLLSILTSIVGGLSNGAWMAMLKILLASAAMSACVWISNQALENMNLGHLFVGHLIKVLAGMAVGIVIFIASARLLKLEEVELAKSTLVRKFGRKK